MRLDFPERLDLAARLDHGTPINALPMGGIQ